MKPHVFHKEIMLVGPQGACQVEVALSFSIQPKQFSAGMAMIATKELQDAVQLIMNEARKLK